MNQDNEESRLIRAVCGIREALPEPLRRTGPLSAYEIDILRSGGAIFPTPEEAEACRVPNHRRLVESCRKIAEAALIERDVANTLGLTDTEVRRRAQQKPPQLHRFELNGSFLYPRWQFDDQGFTIPHLSALLAVVDEVGDLSAFTVHSVMLRPTNDLEVDENDPNEEPPISPRDYLLLGCDPEPVLHIFRFIHYQFE
ncbi:hypothetical protein OZ656_04625 [Marinobacter sp. LM1]|jgi:hypothetical protein|uniref:hypothetical protein n=1 Tax=Marinobacter sp. LM1 TaxID=3003349 RepID=UPI0036D3DD30|tara:strand:+ start:2170 stop:2763 length:594 start_codon:yes stop_codon:yes gene_type:complete